MREARGFPYDWRPRTRSVTRRAIREIYASPGRALRRIAQDSLEIRLPAAGRASRTITQARREIRGAGV